ncbi:MAG: MBL fold metallo-hydrolase, partial [Lachnospiraceae bacterium]|nr:MBL fold metallo-hydrolase [Lachnospiraceae bacterium]
MLLLCAIGILTMKLYTGVEITMLDVGQGDGVVIQNSNGNVYLSDCGSSSVSKVGKYRLIPFLKYKGYGKIKGIFLSHMDEDHINGIWELLEAAPGEHILIEYLFLPESVLAIQEDKQALEELKALASKNDTKLVFLSKGEEIVDGDLQFRCLYPETVYLVSEDIAGKEGAEVADINSKETTEVGNRNNSSLVLSMQYKEFEMLFTGDVEEEGEWDIVRYEKTKREQEREQSEMLQMEDIDILKVAHHGSSGSTCTEFLEEFKPKLSLISCGKNNTYGHPHEETIERLMAAESAIMTTPECGAIKIKVSANGRIKISCWNKVHFTT